MRYEVVVAHKSNYPDPIAFTPGDRLKLGRRDSEYPGWRWVTIPSGNAGWAPETLIDAQSADAGVALADYTARELDTAVSQRLVARRELLGWVWVENEAGETGWAPLATLRALSADEEEI